MQTNIKFNLQPKQRPKLADEFPVKKLIGDIANLIVDGESHHNWPHGYWPAVDNPVVAEITKGHRLLLGSRTRHELRYHDWLSENGIAVVVPQIVAVFILELTECHSRLVIHEPSYFTAYFASLEKYRLNRSS